MRWADVSGIIDELGPIGRFVRRITLRGNKKGTSFPSLNLFKVEDEFSDGTRKKTGLGTQ